MELSDNEKRLLVTPFKDLSAAECVAAFSLSDKISEYNRSQPYTSNDNITLIDRDKLLANGIVSPLDGKTTFHNRQAWADHLKRNDCVEIGNDFNKSTEKKREIKGDFDCRKELTEATHQVMEKYGH